MSRRSAAWITVSPSGTSIRRPSISTVGTGRLRSGPERAAAAGGVLLELGPVLGQERAGRHGGRVGERTDRRAHHVAGDVEEEVDVAGRRRDVSVLEPPQDLLEPPRPFTAGSALPARLVVEEPLEDEERPHHTDGLVHHHDTRRAEKRARLLHRVHVHRDVDLVWGEDRHRGTPRDDGLQLPATRDAARMGVDDLAQRGAHGELVSARAHDVARNAEELRPWALLGPDGAEPVRAAEHDVRHAGERLDVVDDRRAAEEAVRGRKRRLDARVGALPLERLDEPGLLAADVGARPAVHPDGEVETRAEDVRAEEPARPAPATDPSSTAPPRANSPRI